MKFTSLCKKLKSAGIIDAAYEAKVIAEEFCGISPAHLMAFPDTDLSDIDGVLERRLSGEPLQYIIGRWDFFGLQFKIREGCLIPRSDTEMLVERAIKSIPEGSAFADLCSGSGCIGISVLANRKDLRCISCDLYSTPLELTEENAILNGVSDRICVVKADVLSDFRLPEDVGFILSNPPYIRSDVVPTLDSAVLREPHCALDGGSDGLTFYRVILDICRERGVPALLEIGFDQGEDLRTLAAARGLSCAIYKDYSGNERVAEIRTGE